MFDSPIKPTSASSIKVTVLENKPFKNFIKISSCGIRKREFLKTPSALRTFSTLIPTLSNIAINDSTSYLRRCPTFLSNDLANPILNSGAFLLGVVKRIQPSLFKILDNFFNNPISFLTCSITSEQTIKSNLLLTFFNLLQKSLFTLNPTLPSRFISLALLLHNSIDRGDISTPVTSFPIEAR